MPGMETKLNWGRLYSQGRCKAIGVPWNNEELKAWQSGIPAKYVRLGILSVGDYEKRKNKEKPGDLIHKSKDELLMEAHKKGIPATHDADEETIIRLIENKGKDPDKETKPEPKPKAEPVVAAVEEKPTKKPKKKGKKSDEK